jgi:signal transduction histidine kinase
MRSWKQISLRARILLLLAALVLTSMVGGVVTMWHTYRMDHLFTLVIDTDVIGLQAAEELETSLTRQKGLTTYFFLDGDPEWLTQLNQLDQAFNTWLKKARSLAETNKELGIINEIESNYLHYSFARDQVIELYKKGEREAGAKRHWEVRQEFFAIRELCDQYKEIHEAKINLARTQSRVESRVINRMALVAIPCVLILGVLLVFVLINQVLRPIRQLAAGVTGGDIGTRLPDEMIALRSRVDSLIDNVDQAETQLEESREHLLSPTQQEDFEVISEEIRRLDTIVQNFLEFSRPPKLKMQKISPSDVVDMSLQLLKHRLESYRVQVEVERQRRLPQIEADPEQLKEALINLLVNAYEAVGDGGSIVIREEEGVAEPLGQVVVIRVSDNGPGIPESIQENLFQPFFSTKEEGTGLGLSIAFRIVEEHGGWLSLKSREGGGATFVITLPSKEEVVWPRS